MTTLPSDVMANVGPDLRTLALARDLALRADEAEERRQEARVRHLEALLAEDPERAEACLRMQRAFEKRLKELAQAVQHALYPAGAAHAAADAPGAGG